MNNKSSSIHPRVDGGKTRFEKVNTSATAKRGTVERKIAGISRHLKEHPNNNVAKGHLAKLNKLLASLPAS